jgi:hypothetical protein
LPRLQAAVLVLAEKLKLLTLQVNVLEATSVTFSPHNAIAWDKAIQFLAERACSPSSSVRFSSLK